LSPQNVIIAALGAAVIGLGTVVAIDHTAAAPQAPAAAASNDLGVSHALGASPALRNFVGTAMGGSTSGKRGMFAQQIAQLFGLTPDQLKSAIEAGQTLDQIAGANDQKIKDEVLGYVSMALDQGVTKGAITPAQESRVKQDLTDLINQLFAAKLGNLKAGG
jgi:hypothetical protein